MSVIDRRALYHRGLLSVGAILVPDDHSSPTDRDFDSDAHEREYVTRYNNGDWVFVGIIVGITWNDREIGTASLYGVEHGNVGDGIVANAWQMTPAEHQHPNTLIMGSPLAGVVSDALDDAQQWLDSLGADFRAESVHGALYTARQWAEPITVRSTAALTTMPPAPGD